MDWNLCHEPCFDKFWCSWTWNAGGKVCRTNKKAANRKAWRTSIHLATHGYTKANWWETWHPNSCNRSQIETQSQVKYLETSAPKSCTQFYRGSGTGWKQTSDKSAHRPRCQASCCSTKCLIRTVATHLRQNTQFGWSRATWASWFVCKCKSRYMIHKSNMWISWRNDDLFQSCFNSLMICWTGFATYSAKGHKAGQKAPPGVALPNIYNVYI